MSLIPSKSGRNLETGEPGDGASSPHYAMHNIDTQSTHLFMPLAHASFAAGNIPVATAWQARKEQFEEPKKKKDGKKKKENFRKPRPCRIKRPPAAPGPFPGPAKTRSQGPIPLSGRPLANPPQIRGHHVAYQYCIVCTIL